MSKSLLLTQFCTENNISFTENEPMSKHTTFKIGGPAEFFIRPDSAERLCGLVAFLKAENIPYTVIGKGSNLLVSDDGIKGAVICLDSNFSDVKVDLTDDTIECTAGTSLSQLCRAALDNSLSGVEFAWGIPGSVGGAVYMNAGAYGGEVKDVVVSCTYINEKGDIITKNCDELDLSYRHSFFTNTNNIILSAKFKLIKKDKAEIRSKMDELMLKRKTKQPLEYPSAGSTFKRPEGNYAAALIEQCGLKGYSFGGAQVSEKHSGFVINKGGATCKDVLALIENIKEVVYNKTGYRLECEVKLI